MPTEHPRIQVTLEPATSKALSALAAVDSSSLSTTAARLIKEALELHEDRILSRHADSRLKKTKKWLSHKDVWGG